MKDLYSVKLTGSDSTEPDLEVIRPEDVILEGNVPNYGYVIQDTSVEVNETVEEPIMASNVSNNDDELDNKDLEIDEEKELISKLESAVDAVHEKADKQYNTSHTSNTVSSENIDSFETDDELLIERKRRVRTYIEIAAASIIMICLLVYGVIEYRSKMDKQPKSNSIVASSDKKAEDVKDKSEWNVNEPFATADASLEPTGEIQATDEAGVPIADEPVAAGSKTSNPSSKKTTSSNKASSDNSSVSNSGTDNNSSSSNNVPEVSVVKDSVVVADSDFTPKSASLASDVQDGTILHAFNWSYNTIKSNMAAIAKAGYSAVQTSPVQQPKDYNESWKDVSEQWWKLYQPVSFSIAKSSWIGTKNELTALCNEADKYNVKIICDIVVNHMGSNNGDKGALDDEVNTYESEIYNNYSKYFHSYYDCNDSSVQSVVWGSLDMPDLNTSESYVQSRVMSLLDECIECGVDGFRFDAAKHIETSADGSYASSFWNTVLNHAAQTAGKKGIRLFTYGEILNTAGKGRSIKTYTNYMSVTDNVTGNNVLSAVNSSNASSAASSTYKTGLSASDLVIWAESHDTFMESTKGISQTNIDKAYAIVASRVNAASLYLARPSIEGKMGFMGTAGSSAWKSQSVSAINTFHNYFIDSSEYLSYSGKLVLNERYIDGNSSKCGVIIVNLSSGSAAISDITVSKMADGTYHDQITGSKFVVSGGRIKGNIGNTGIAVIY